jgi:hypothetical protein
MKLEFSQQIFGKYTNVQFHNNPFSASRFAPSGRTVGRTDGRTGIPDEADSHFSQFWNALLMSHFLSNGATKTWHSYSYDIKWNATCTISLRLAQI